MTAREVLQRLVIACDKYDQEYRPDWLEDERIKCCAALAAARAYLAQPEPQDERDAARYRWLRDGARNRESPRWTVSVEQAGMGAVLSGITLDETVDAARAYLAQPEPQDERDSPGCLAVPQEPRTWGPTTDGSGMQEPRAGQGEREVSDDTKALVLRLRSHRTWVSSEGMLTTVDPDCAEAAAAIERLERDRDRAVEVADAETKGVYSKHMLEAADAVANERWQKMRIAELERELAESYERAAQVCEWADDERGNACARAIRALKGNA